MLNAFISGAFTMLAIGILLLMYFEGKQLLLVSGLYMFVGGLMGIMWALDPGVGNVTYIAMHGGFVTSFLVGYLMIVISSQSWKVKQNIFDCGWR